MKRFQIIRRKKGEPTGFEGEVCSSDTLGVKLRVSSGAWNGAWVKIKHGLFVAGLQLLWVFIKSPFQHIEIIKEGVTPSENHWVWWRT